MPGFEDFVIQWMTEKRMEQTKGKQGNQGGERGSTVAYSNMVTVWSRMLVGKTSEVDDADLV